jgi:hypothetical protein
MYFECEMSVHLRQIAYNGNDVEKEAALRVLWQLCFDARVLKDVVGDKMLFNYLVVLTKKVIQTLKTDKENSNSHLVKTLHGLLWLIRKSVKPEGEMIEKKEEEVAEEKPVADESLTKTVNEVFAEKRVMISYNRQTRDLCLSIKAELEKFNYKIWIDVEVCAVEKIGSNFLSVWVSVRTARFGN